MEKLLHLRKRRGLFVLKNFSGFPVASINFCLNYCNLTINDIDILAIKSKSVIINFVPKIDLCS